MSATPSRPPPTWWALVVVAVVLSVVSVSALDLDVDALRSTEGAARAWARAGSFARGFIRPDLSYDALTRCGRLALDTVAVAVVGTALGAVAGLGLGLVSSRSAMAGGHPSPGPVSRLAIVLARALLDVFRAIPDFAWALGILVFLGPGPVTGALAIAVTVTGVLGRTYGQLIDAVPSAEVAAVEASGATRPAMAAYGRLPRVAAAAWSYTLVRLECSVRNASVIGIVGGGGLGAELFEELGYGRDDRVATLLLTLLLITAGADIGAGWVRRRLANRSSVADRHRGRVALIVVAALGMAGLWLTPAVFDVGSRLATTDAAFVQNAIGRLAHPDLDVGTVLVAFRSSAVPLATTWLATAGSAAIALSLLPWTSAYLTRRSQGLVRRGGAFELLAWVPSVTLRALALVARAVPDVAWLLLIAAALRMGHAAALLALALHSCGVLIRVFTETVDDAGAADRARGPGGRAAWLTYRIVPSVRSTIVTHTLLQGEANLRAAVVLGIVGAGGLGDAFHSAVSYWQLERASTLAIAMVVIFVAVDRLARRLSKWSVGRETAARR